MTSESVVSRRSVATAAAWVAPAVAVAIAAPLASASVTPPVTTLDLTTSIVGPSEAPDTTTTTGATAYTKNSRPLTSTATFVNNGPAALPVGSHFSVTYISAARISGVLNNGQATTLNIVPFSSYSAVSISGGLPYTALPDTTVALGGGNTRTVKSYRLEAPLAAGASFTFVFRLVTNAGQAVPNNLTSATFNTSFRSIVALGSAVGVTETDLSNNEAITAPSASHGNQTLTVRYK